MNEQPTALQILVDPRSSLYGVMGSVVPKPLEDHGFTTPVLDQMAADIGFCPGPIVI